MGNTLSKKPNNIAMLENHGSTATADSTAGSTTVSNAISTTESLLETADSTAGSNTGSTADSTAGSTAVSTPVSNAISNAEQLLALSKAFVGKMSRIDILHSPKKLEIFALCGSFPKTGQTDVFKLVFVVGMIKPSGMIEYIPIYSFELKSKPSKIEFQFSGNCGFSLNVYGGQEYMGIIIRSLICESGDYALQEQRFFSFCRVRELNVIPSNVISSTKRCHFIDIKILPSDWKWLIYNNSIESAIFNLDLSTLSTLSVYSGNWHTLSLLHSVQWDMSTLRGLNLFSGTLFKCAFMNELVRSHNSSSTPVECPDILHKQSFAFSTMTEAEFSEKFGKMTVFWREEKNLSKKDEIRAQMKKLREDFRKIKSRA